MIGFSPKNYTIAAEQAKGLAYRGGFQLLEGIVWELAGNVSYINITNTLTLFFIFCLL